MPDQPRERFSFYAPATHKQRGKKAQIRKFLNEVNEGSITKERLYEMVWNFVRREKNLRRLFRWDETKKYQGLGTFIVRQNEKRYGILELTLRELRTWGWQVLDQCEIPPEGKQVMASLTPSPFWDGEYPYACAVVFDVRPRSMYPLYYRKFPKMDNARLLCKHLIRPKINALLPKDQQANHLHSSDNVEDAWCYIRLSMPEREAALRDEIARKYPTCPKCGPRFFLRVDGTSACCRRCSQIEKS